MRFEQSQESPRHENLRSNTRTCAPVREGRHMEFWHVQGEAGESLQNRFDLQLTIVRRSTPAMTNLAANVCLRFRH